MTALVLALAIGVPIGMVLGAWLALFAVRQPLAQDLGVREEIGKTIVYDNYVLGSAPLRIMNSSREHVVSGRFDRDFELDPVRDKDFTTLYLIKK